MTGQHSRRDRIVGDLVSLLVGDVLGGLEVIAPLQAALLTSL